MQEKEELRALKREIKMSREGKVKRKICVWKRKKEKYKSRWRFIRLQIVGGYVFYPSTPTYELNQHSDWSDR
jgi:hypothetical protein